jgi:hypothetical protein
MLPETSVASTSFKSTFSAAEAGNDAASRAAIPPARINEWCL